jgi:DmsE family decaheme c-type cytochrome
MHAKKKLSFPAMAAVILTAGWATAVVAATGVLEESSLRGARLSQTAPPQKPAPPVQAPAAAAGYVGADTCLGCHADQTKGYADSMHGRAAHPRAPAAGRGCESCHGPGGKHIEDPTVPGSIRRFNQSTPPKEASEACLTCHSRGAHAVWEGSVHDSRNLSCTTCHSIHAFKSEKSQLKTVREMDTCAPCHRDKVAKIDRSGHMPLREGKMACSTCHNPHGSTNVKLLRKGDSIAEMCTTCHAEKRGPFLWEHAPSRDGCTTCHDPHGTSNERMLVTKPPILCQRCHVATRHPSTIYDAALIGSAPTPSVRIYARSCVTCHSNIHGSNHPSGQRFIR